MEGITPFTGPERCLREGCKSTKMWGHGFVLLCIEGYDQPLPISAVALPDMRARVHDTAMWLLVPA